MKVLYLGSNEKKNKQEINKDKIEARSVERK